MENKTPLYATVHYEVRRQLDVSFTEYIYLDMVHKLSYHSWCYKSLENCARDLGISKFGTMKMRDRLIARGLMEKNIKGHLRVTRSYTDVAVNKVDRSNSSSVNKVDRSNSSSVNKVDRSVNKVQRVGQQSLPKNNNRITREYKNQDNSVSGYLKARAQAEKLRRARASS